MNKKKENRHMRVLGIDPGIGRVGWGVIQKEKGKVKAWSYDCFETPTGMKPEERLMLVYDEIDRLLGLYNPDVLAIEELFFSKNVKTGLSVAEARGVILLCAAKHKVPVAVYPPTVVKDAVAGYGHAEKAQIGEMVKMTLKLPKVPTPDDTADALAIALTHAYSQKFPTK